MVGGSYWFSDKLALKSAKARIVTEEDAPLFFGMVKDLAERAGMPMPRVAIAPNEQPNAFATGRDPDHALIAFTTGILDVMDRDQLQGVIAHELAHVANRDTLVSAVAARSGEPASRCRYRLGSVSSTSMISGTPSILVTMSIRA